jgi:hypothetical protein
MSGLEGGYLESGASGSHVTNLQVLFATGEAWTFCVSPNTLGRDVGKLVSERLGSHRNGKFALHHGTSALVFHRFLAGTRDRGQISSPVMHVFANRSLCSMVLCERTRSS